VDPLCTGRICTISCTQNDECIDAVDTPNADQAICGSDGLCNFVQAGVGRFWCA
jgi:hypothetical protein